MNSFIVLFAAVANVIAVLLVYYSFGKKMDKQKKFMNTLIGMGFICILVWCAFSLSSIGIEKISAIEKAKTLLTIAFVPVDAILFIPFLVSSFYKCKEEKITKKAFSNRVIIIAIFAIVVMVGEFFYFRNFQKDIVKLNEQIKANQEIEENNVENLNEEKQDNAEDTNKIDEEDKEIEENIETNNTNQVIENNNEEIETNNINSVSDDNNM